MHPDLLDQLVILASKDLLAAQDPRDRVEIKEQKDQKDHRDPLDNLDSQDHLVRAVSLEAKDK